MSNQKKERWVGIPGYIGLYEASSFGRIRSFFGARRKRYRNPRIMNPNRRTDKYPSIKLWKNGNRIGRDVHRVIAESFLGSCPFGLEVNHKDGNKENNAIENLEYVTRMENLRHAYFVLGKQARGESHSNSKLSNDEVLKIRLLCGSGHYQSDVAKRYGVAQSVVSQIVNRKRWAHI